MKHKSSRSGACVEEEKKKRSAVRNSQELSVRPEGGEKMCGVIALVLGDGDSDCCGELVDGLTTLQHRGQDAAGVVVASTNREWAEVKFRSVRSVGLVRDIFGKAEPEALTGNVGIGHVRYPTTGDGALPEVQPFYVNYPCGLSLAHNGNLTNAEELRRELVSSHRHLNTTSDSEILLNVLAEQLTRALHARRVGSPKSAGSPFSDPLDAHSVFQAVAATTNRCRGGYAVVALIHNVGVLAFRDPWGIRPLVFGRRRDGDGGAASSFTDYAVASESVALDTLGYELCRDVAPGEAILIRPSRGDAEVRCDARICHDAPRLAPCIFEYVYFSRPDSMMNGVSVYEAQLNMGDKLAAKILRTFGRDNHGIDVVIAVPDTSRPIALRCAYSLDVPYREGFIKNRYVGRTFIMPGQRLRRKGVRMKLNTIKSEFAGKAVLLVDDSIVRGTTSVELVAMARDAGAAKVFFVSASPEVRYPNVYGINISSQHELLAHNRSAHDIARHLGADWVIFQDLADLEDAVRALNPDLTHFEASVFSGTYVTADVVLDTAGSLAARTPKDAPPPGAENGRGLFGCHPDLCKVADDV
ncbi:MAG: amidophosphoribosyltransferase, partial [Bacteroidota bacterium]